MARILYLSYDGLMEPLGQSQIWQYMRHLAKTNKIILITYEKKRDWSDIRRRKSLWDETRNVGVCWIPLRYHKHPKVLSTVFDMAIGLVLGIYLVPCYRIQIIHSRNPPLSLVALILKMIFGVRFLFDMRGFWADERVDGGLWKKDGWLYRINKWLERHYFLKADTVVVLTHAALDKIRKFDYLKKCVTHFEVIPTCTNLELFYLEKSNEKIDTNIFVLGYVGSTSSWYLFNNVLECAGILQQLRTDAKFFVITRDAHDQIKEELRSYTIDQKQVMIETVNYSQVGEKIRQMTAGIFFYKPGFSSSAKMPTRLGEFLACGIPCLCNSGIGDVDEIFEKERVGVLLHEFNLEAETDAVKNLLKLVDDPKTKDRCAAIAKKYFSLENGINKYNEIYEHISNR